MVKLKFISSVCILGALMVMPAWSAPSVKKLGGINAYAGTAGATSVKTGATKTDSNIAARAGSVRSVKTLSAKPTTMVNKTVDSANTARLSVGKYLHTAGTNAGIIKPVSNSSVTPSEITNLEEQITSLQDQVNNNYYTKEDIENKNYVTEVNVVENDEPADTNKMINGIDVQADGKTLKVRRSNIKIPVGSENGSPTASIWIEE